MDATESSIKTWLKFFLDAGIPAGVATEYAITFSDNRMRLNMLPELSKDYLHDLNITILGDVIAILKHAKAVTQQEYTAQKMGSEAVTPAPSLSAAPTRTPAASTESPAARMVKRLVRKEPPKATSDVMETDDALEPASKRLKSSGRLGAVQTPVAGVGKKTVFDRLGADNQVSSTTPDTTKFRITGLSPTPAQRVWFSDDPPTREVRAGPQLVTMATEPAAQRVTMFTGPALEYKGVLKSAGRTDREDYQMLRRKTTTHKAPAQTKKGHIEMLRRKTTTHKAPAQTKKAIAPSLAMDREQKPTSARSRLGGVAQTASGSPRQRETTQVRALTTRHTKTVATSKSGAVGGSVRSRLGPTP